MSQQFAELRMHDLGDLLFKILTITAKPSLFSEGSELASQSLSFFFFYKYTHKCAYKLMCT